MRRHPSRSRVSRLASRLLAGAAVGVLAAGLAGAPALAQDPDPSPTASDEPGTGGGGDAIRLVGPQTAGTPGCALPANADEVTGIAVMADGRFGLINGDSAQQDSQILIIYLDAACAAEPETWGRDPREPQDLVFANGAFYVCDCGDESKNRPTIAYEKVIEGGAEAPIFRFAPPTPGSVHARAMVLTAGDLPVFFAEEGGVTAIYTAATLPAADDTNGSPLTRAGQWTPPVQTTTPSGQGTGSAVVTGAAMSPDGTKIVIRTYSDAYEYAVTGGDIVTAIQGDPIGVTPLPNEPKGEAITYSADGTQFITASSGTGGLTLLSYTPFVAPDPVETTAVPTETAADGGFLSRFSMSQLTQMIAAVGVVGIVLAIAGIIGIRRARRRRMEDDDWDDDDDYDDDDYDDRRSRRGRGRGRGRDDYREPAYSGGAGYDDSFGGGYGQDYTGYQQGYDQQQGYGQDYTGGYQQGYGAPGYEQQPGYVDPGYVDPGYVDPAYGGQPAQPGYDDYGQPGYGDYGRRQGY